METSISKVIQLIRLYCAIHTYFAGQSQCCQWVITKAKVQHLTSLGGMWDLWSAFTVRLQALVVPMALFIS